MSIHRTLNLLVLVIFTFSGFSTATGAASALPRNDLLNIPQRSETDPVVEFTSNSYEVWENGGTATITVTLSEPSTYLITVQVNTIDGTAVAGNDYTPVDQVLLFPPGETLQTVSVEILEDTLIEADEYLTVTLSNPTHTQLGPNSSASLTILDNDGFADGGVIVPGQYYSHQGRAWGDYDNDGDLDFVFSYQISTQNYVRINQNQGDGTFVTINPGIPGVDYSDFEWCDYDRDGDLDLLVIGRLIISPEQYITAIYRNNGNGTFGDIDAGLVGEAWGSGAWGDYDNDGYPDVLIIGQVSSGGIHSETHLYHNNGNNTFTDIGANLINAQGGDVAWGDYDNDGDMDILLAGFVSPSGHTAKVYRNDGNGHFTDLNAGLTGASGGSAAWGDYNNDGYLDILLTGCTATSCPTSIARVYRNNGNSTFTNIGAGLPGTDGYGVSSWGDYNNDGYLDILLTGVQTNPAARIYRNNGDNTFTDISAIFSEGLHHGATAWGDADNDGDLDILLYYHIYWNKNQNSNLKPSSPVTLPPSYQGNSVRLSWDAASDDHTPASGLTYNVRIGTYPGGNNILPSMASRNGYRFIPAMGNAQKRLTATVSGLSWDRTYYWSVQAIDSAYLGSSFSQEATFGLPAVRLDQSYYNVPENSGTGLVTVTLTAASPVTTMVDYSTHDVTAIGGVDYTPITGTLVFAPGEVSKVLSVPVIDNMVDEDDRLFTFTIKNPMSATLGTPSTAIINIQDDDPPPMIQLNTAAILIGEDAVTATFTATLSAVSAKIIYVDYQTISGTALAYEDYTPIFGSLFFAPGESSKGLSVSLLNDTLDEEDESFALALANPLNASLGVPVTATITILDDDPPPSVRLNSEALQIGEDALTATLTATLSAISAKTISVDFLTIAGTASPDEDYTPIVGTLTFTPGEVSQAVSIPILNDGVDEEDEFFTLALTNTLNATPGTPFTVTVIIQDDDPLPSIQLNASSIAVDEADHIVTHTVTLSAISAKTVSVDYQTDPMTAFAYEDYIPISGTLVFAPGQISKTLAVSILDDTQDEADEVYTLSLVNPANATLGVPSSTAITILDNDPPPSIQLSAGSTNVDEDSPSVSFTVTLSAISGKTISVDYQTTPGTASEYQDYMPISGTLVFAPGEMSKGISVPILDDVLDEEDEIFTLSLVNPLNVNLGTPFTATVSIVDNDSPPVILLDTMEITVSEDANTITLTVTLSAVSAKTISLEFQTIPGTASPSEDYIPITGTLVFSPGETTKLITLTICDDNLAEPTEQFTLWMTHFVNAGPGEITVPVIITDNDVIVIIHYPIYLPFVTTPQRLKP